MKKKTKKQIIIVSVILAIALLIFITNNPIRNTIQKSLFPNQFLSVTSSCPSGTNYCSSISPSSRYVCNNGVVTKYNCPTGETCSNGQCVSQGQNLCPSGSKYCSNLDIIYRYSCSNGVVTKYSCPTGQYCDNGDCISASGGNTNLCPSGNKYCSSLTSNSRYECNSNTGVVTKYNCPTGQICEGDGCRDVQTYCSDSDGNDYKTKGTVTTTYEGRSNNQDDYCSDSNILYELTCSNNWITSTKIDCSLIGSGYYCSDGKCVETKSGDLCPSGDDYCSSLTPNSVYSCSNGVVTKYNCEGQNVCEEGKCVSPYESCQTCNDFTLNYMFGGFVESLKCKPRILALPPQTVTTCLPSFIKYIVLPFAFIFSFIFGQRIYRKLTKSKDKYVLTFLSLVSSFIITYSLYIFLSSFIFWLILIFIAVIWIFLNFTPTGRAFKKLR